MKKSEKVNFILNGKSSQFPLLEFDKEKQNNMFILLFYSMHQNNFLVFTDYLLTYIRFGLVHFKRSWSNGLAVKNLSVELCT